jgi:DNA repair photolyase
MNNSFETFEQQGLKIDKERVLTYSKLSCPLDCTYCFVNEMTQEQSKGAAYLNEQQLDLLKNLPEQVKLIMLGCDTEFFQNKKEAMGILEKLSEHGKDISVITKLSLSEEYINFLGDIHAKMERNGNIFSFSVSIPCLSDLMLDKYEPKVPHPEKRIETLSAVHKKGIPTTTAIRPLLPDIPDGELEAIVAKTKDYCFGYYSGPLYLKEDKIKLFLPEYDSKPETEHQPNWMLEGNQYQAVEKTGQMDFLASLVKGADREFFDGAADAIEFLRKKKEHEKLGDKS